MITSDLEKIEFVISALDEFAKTGAFSNEGLIQNQIENFLQMPASDDETKSMFSHPFILWNYAEAGFTRLANRLEEKDFDLLRKITDLEPKESNWVRLRKFQPKHANYYGFEFREQDIFYSFWDDEPILLTKIPQEWLDEQKHESELGWIARPEVRALSSLSFSVDAGLCFFQLSDKVADLPASLILGNETELSETSLKRALLAVRILARMEMQDFQGFKTVLSESSPFRFRTDGLSLEKAKRLYSCFDINDKLMLRVGFCLLKSAMLWSHEGNIFGEDACANLFFGLEGCLRLIHQKFIGSKEFKFTTVIQHIEQVFISKPGFTWMLSDAYEKRIAIVHPEPRVKSNWIPPLAEDDFYENYDMAIDLFYYAITGEMLSRY